MSTDNPSPTPTPLRLAELLSDLVSLRLASPAAALALVSARASTTTTSSETEPKTEKDEEEEDVDIARAKELVELHYGVKEAHRRGELARGLEEARGAVGRAVGG